MTWPAGIDFTDAALRTLDEVLPDIITAINERCDGARADRLFFVAAGNPNAAYSGAITSITVTFSSDPGTFNTRGVITLSEGTAFDEFTYTAVSGSGTSRTFTVSVTLAGSYTTAANAVVTEVDTDHLQLYAVSDITDAIDSKITALIPLYADHTQATGTEFTGLASIPIWTEAALLTEIGDTARITGLLQATSDWVAQVFNIINLLLWVRHVSSGANLNYGTTKFKQPLPPENTWADVVTNWPAGWTDYSGAAFDNDLLSFGTKLVDLRYRGEQWATNMTYLTGNGTIKHAADLYIYSTKENSSQAPPLDVYDANGLNLAENEYGRLISKAAAATAAGEFDVQATLTANGAPADPTGTGAPRYHGWIDGESGTTTTRRIAVLRYNVTDGFSYT